MAETKKGKKAVVGRQKIDLFSYGLVLCLFACTVVLFLMFYRVKGGL